METQTGTQPVRSFDRMAIISAASDNGMSSEFPRMIAEAFRKSAAQCGIKADFFYERLDGQPVRPGLAASSGIELSVVPKRVFDNTTQSYMFESGYGYFATLTDRSKNLELWKASFLIYPKPDWSGQNSAHLAAVISNTLFKKMAQDGVVHGCLATGQDNSPK